MREGHGPHATLASSPLLRASPPLYVECVGQWFTQEHLQDEKKKGVGGAAARRSKVDDQPPHLQCTACPGNVIHQ
jgi:hypothetical protein